MEDLVAKTLLQSLDEVDLERWSTGGFQSHLRRRILDSLGDELGIVGPPGKGEAGPQPCMLERIIGQGNYERYESALRRLADEDREAIIARIELNFPYAKVAELLGKSSPDDARKAAIQALLRLAREMGNST
jgi:DNA-directed RNA polymerase specialized sigma24 family protein